MATMTGEGKSGFLKEFFVDHPDAGKAEIDQAWREAGHDGSISGSLISKVRSEPGLTAGGRGRGGGGGGDGGGGGARGGGGGGRGGGGAPRGRAEVRRTEGRIRGGWPHGGRADR